MRIWRPRKRWQVTVPGSDRAHKVKKAKDVVKVALVGSAICATYIGVIALLMAPIVDLA